MGHAHSVSLGGKLAPVEDGQVLLFDLHTSHGNRGGHVGVPQALSPPRPGEDFDGAPSELRVAALDAEKVDGRHNLHIEEKGR